MMHISSADQTRSVKNILPFPVSFCRWGAFKKANIKQLNIKDFFKHRTSTGSEVFLILKCLDATKFVLLSFFTIMETTCSKIWAKPPPVNKKSLLAVDVRRSKTSLLKLSNTRTKTAAKTSPKAMFTDYIG